MPCSASEATRDCVAIDSDVYDVDVPRCFASSEILFINHLSNCTTDEVRIDGIILEKQIMLHKFSGRFHCWLCGLKSGQVALTTRWIAMWKMQHTYWMLTHRSSMLTPPYHLFNVWVNSWQSSTIEHMRPCSEIGWLVHLLAKSC